MDKARFTVVALELTLLCGWNISYISLYNAKKPFFQLF